MHDPVATAFQHRIHELIARLPRGRIMREVIQLDDQPGLAFGTAHHEIHMLALTLLR